MLAYAANRPVAGKRQSSPNALLVVISIHVALLAVVMSAKMELPGRVFHPAPTILSFPKPPPPPPSHHATQPRQTERALVTPSRTVPLPPIDSPNVDTSGPTVDPGPVIGGGTAIIPDLGPSVVTPIRHDPRLLTPPSELKPPYPASKLLTEEEAVLRLRLTIDEHGRVIAVDPVGRADSIFLQAAQRYLVAHWRYQPATEDGRPVASSTVITLRFQLDG
jgi:protein TonB